jgi:hypothetical protein
MSIDPENWLVVEQIMEEENHSLLQDDKETTEQQPIPQLLVISSLAAHGTSSAATFSVLVSIGGKRALIDSGNTDTFMDYTFASKTSCSLLSTTSRKVRVVGGEHLEASTITCDTLYSIQHETFNNSFKLLPLKGYDIILGCD